MRNIILIGIACLGISALIVVDRWQVGQWHAEKAIALHSTAQLCKTRLEHSIATRLDAIESLAALFILHPDTKPEEFAHFASLLIGTNPPIRALQYADSETQVTYVYPPKNNEITIARPMLLLADPKRGPFVKKAIAQRTASIQGPFELRQGGMGIVVRLPFFTGGAFSGLAIGIYDVPVLVKEALAGLDLEQFIFRIADHEGQIFWGAKEIDKAVQMIPVSVGDTQWAISVNWKPSAIGPPALPRALVWFFGVGFILSAVIIIQLLRKQTQRLEKVIGQRTRDLYQSNADLADKVLQQEEAESALKKSEQRFELAMQSANDGLYDWDLETNKVYYSPVWKALLGYAGDEITDELSEWERLTRPEDVKSTYQMLGDVLSGKRDRLEAEYKMLHQNGQWVDILSRARAVFDESGKAVRVVGTHMDITQRKQAEASLKSNEEQFRTFFNQSFQFSLILNSQGAVLAANDLCYAVFGDLEESVVGVPLWKVGWWEPFPETVRKTKIAVQKVLAGDSVHDNVEFVDKYENMRHGMRIFSPIKDSRGKIFRISVVGLDVTERKQTEEKRKWELRLSMARADISRELIAQKYDIDKISGMTMEYAMDLTLSRNGFVSSVDDMTGERFGHILSGMNDDQCQMDSRRISFSMNSHGRYNALWGHALNTKEAFFTNQPDKHPSSNGIPEGHIPMNNFLAVPVLIGERPAGLIALANSADDYSEKELNAVKSLSEIYALALYRNQYELERVKMERKLQQLQKLEAIGTLAGGIAHDFNNILFPIVGLSEMLLEDLADNSPERESAEAIFSAANRGSDLVKQILAFSRQAEHKNRPVRIQQILKEVLKLSRRTIPSNIEIVHDIQKECGIIFADPTQVHQIAMNLITNAYHAVEQSGGTISVELKEKSLDGNDMSDNALGRGRYAMLNVSDTGNGIDPAVKDKIFEPYFTTKAQGKGTGLGLSVVYGIVKGCHGDVKVHSEVGKGATFNVYLPVMEKSADTGIVERSKPLPTGTERILLVDDEASIVDLETKMLERLGYRVRSSVSSLEALEIFRADPHAYDLVLTDMAMPQMAGDQLAIQLAYIRPDIPMIICTGFSAQLSRHRAEAMGIKGFLMKPIIKSELARIVRKVLDEANQKRS